VEPHPILDDPDGHFPYKADAAREALATPPDPDTNNHPETWYTSDGIIDATDRYVQAQAIHFADPTDTTRAAMDAAAQALVAARQGHRSARDGVGVLAGHPVEVVFALRRHAGRTPEQIAEQLRMPLAEVRSILGQNVEG
jgi:DNA-directed RNA polymerase specialized sigma24 family protein